MSKVSDLLRPLPVRVSAVASLETVARRFADATRGPLAVVTPGGKYLGLIRLRDVLDVFPDRELAKLVTAADLVQAGADFLATDDSLEVALERFANTEADSLAVVGPPKKPLIVGYIARDDLLLACARRRMYVPSAHVPRRCASQRMHAFKTAS